MYVFTATQSHDLVLTTKVTLLIDRYMFILLLNVTSQEFIYMWMYEALVLTSFGRLWKAKHLMDLLQVIVKSLFAQCHPCIIIIKSLSGRQKWLGLYMVTFHRRTMKWKEDRCKSSPCYVCMSTLLHELHSYSLLWFTYW